MRAPEPEPKGGDLRTTCYNCGVSMLKDEGHVRCKGKDYCGTCFAASDTNRQEPYLVIPPLNFVPSRDSQCSQDTPIPAENDPSSASTPPDASIWTVADTLALLDAVAKVGVGSWDDVLARMHQAGAGSSKEITPSQCRSWFMLLYSTWEASSSTGKAAKDSIAGQVLEADGHCSVMNPMADHEGPVVDSVLGKRKRDISGGKDIDKYIPGYTPRRGDFEVDYDDCAELLLADMEFQPNERPEDVKMKVDVLLAYNARLSLREQMKRYVVARDMVVQQPPPPAYPMSGGVPPPPPVNAQTRAGQILNRLFRPVERFFDSKVECDEFKQ
ncbi:Transcriptional adapter 2-alpha, partial [Perkinsus olseni]